MDEQNFKDAFDHLQAQAKLVILELRDNLMNIDKEDILTSEQVLGRATEFVIASYDGLKKIAHVMEFMYAWEELGDMPVLGLTDDDVLKNFVGESKEGE